MRARTLLGCLAAFMLASCTLAVPLSPHFNAKTMMPSDEIERGMKAIGKSVFSGIEITEFNLEILAVLEQGNQGRPMIVARILDGPVVERESGVMGGMSGSPVYIDGRLIGAVAFTWPWEKEPVAGITDINSMLEALDKPEKQAEVSPFSTETERFAAHDGAFRIAGRNVSRIKVVPRWEATSRFADAHTMVMYRVAPPVYCAGLPDAAMDYLKGTLKRYGIEPIAGPGAKGDPVDVDLQPGSAFGSTLVSGDFDISTGGTLTYRDGDLILGFGHPFMELGDINFPLTTSWVHDFIPRYQRTDKMMSVMKPVGVLTQDRNWSVGGKLGPMAEMVPATIKITDTTRDLTRTYKVKCLKDRDTTPSLLSTSILSALYATYNSPGEGMVKVKTRVKGSKGHEITREDIYYHSGMAGMPAITDTMQSAFLLTQNRFRPQDVVGLEYEAELSAIDNTAAIESIYADQTVAKAGEDLTLHVRLRPDDGDLIEKTVKLKMPLSLPKGRIRVGVCAGNEAMRLRSRVAIMPPTLYSLDDVVEQIETLERGDQLFVAAGSPTKDVAIQGTKLFGLAPFMRAVLGGTPRTDIVRGGAEISRTFDMPWVLYGSAMLTLATEDRQGGRGKVTAPPSPPKSSSSAAFSLPSLPEEAPARLWWASSAFADPNLGLTAQPAAAPFDFWPSAVEPESEKKPNTTERRKPDKLPSSADKKDDKDKEQPKDKKNGDVARRPKVWLQTTADQFAAGEWKGVAIRSDGAVQLAPTWTDVKTFDEPYVWAMAAGDKDAYAGTINDGKIYKLTGDAPTLLCDTGQFGVSSMVVNADGSITAATFPGGKVLRIDAAGKRTELCDLGDAYVWDMIADGEGGYFAATGPDAAVYQISAEGESKKIIAIRQGHATELLKIGDALYVATAQKGALYRLDEESGLVSLYDTGSNDVTGLVEGDDGSVLLSTAPDGQVISINPKGLATVLYEAEDGAIMGLARTKGRTFASLTEDGQVIEIIDSRVHTVLREEESNTGLSLCSHGPRLYLTTDAPGRVVVANLDAPAKGQLESDVLDAKRRARWGRVDWSASVGEKATLDLRFRSGGSEDPKDDSWSPWSAPIGGKGLDRPGVAPARFIQYRLQLSKDSGAQAPTLDWIRLRYLPDNQAPEVKTPTPKEGEAISGKFKLKWKMTDPDKDKLQARILARKHGEGDFQVIKEGIVKSEYEWDTKKQDDGVYDLRIVVDDELANATGSDFARLDIDNVVVDNTPPEIQIISGPAWQDDGGIAVTGFALDATCIVGNVSWREGAAKPTSAKDSKADEDTWRAAWLDDGLYDWRWERFLVATKKLSTKVKAITIRARDAAGNVADKTVKLPPKKKPSKPAAGDAKEKPKT